jgi:hypothetical protein
VSRNSSARWRAIISAPRRVSAESAVISPGQNDPSTSAVHYLPTYIYGSSYRDRPFLHPPETCCDPDLPNACKGCRIVSDTLGD